MIDPGRQSPPTVAVFDVNETLSDTSGLALRFQEVGASVELLEPWFNETLRDGFALTAAGTSAGFAEIAVPKLAAFMTGDGMGKNAARGAAEHVVAGMEDLDLHPDVAPGLRALVDGGMRVVTLSNGSADVAESLLERTGLRDLVEQCLSVIDAGRWKPAPEAYGHAVASCETERSKLAMIAVHPWDIDGATRAGLRGAWLRRGADEYPPYFSAPEFSGDDLPELAAALLATS